MSGDNPCAPYPGHAYLTRWVHAAAQLQSHPPAAGWRECWAVRPSSPSSCGRVPSAPSVTASAPHLQRRGEGGWLGLIPGDLPGCLCGRAEAARPQGTPSSPLAEVVERVLPSERRDSEDGAGAGGGPTWSCATTPTRRRLSPSEMERRSREGCR